MENLEASLPFSAWMEDALHEPGQGYYSTHVGTVGRRGDFSTAASVSDLLGRAIAHWLRREMQRQSEVRTVIEIGGGNGDLSAAVRRRLGWWCRRSLTWRMVETSPVLLAQQEQRLGSARVTWFQTLQEALAACDGRAFIFHNELVDAFPVRLLQWNSTAADWDEVWMQKSGALWREALQPLKMSAEVRAGYSALSTLHGKTLSPQTSQRVELHASYRDWLHEWCSSWQAGAMLTIDYGDVFPELYHRQPRGTLRAYWKHQRITGPEVYERMGKQDLTADVNFTDLMHWGQELGWSHEPLWTQREFFQACLNSIPRNLTGSPAATFLLGEHGAGTAFKVLVQRPAGAGNRLRLQPQRVSSSALPRFFIA